MNEPSEEVKAMARRVYSQFIIDNTPGAGPCDIPRFDDNAHGVRIALAAILETQRRDAELAAWAHMVPPDGGSPTPEECALAETIATAIRTGTHYGKAEQ